jgi:hypothetical protein
VTATDRVAADHEPLGPADAHLDPGAGAIARIILTVPTLRNKAFQALLLYRTNQIREACLKDR